MDTIKSKEFQWMRLDNAAKIYPFVANAKNSNVFRMSVVMKEPIDAEILKKAVTDCRERFPAFFVKLRKGLFWYYYDENTKDPLVLPESPYICQVIIPHRNNDFLFTFFYYDNRISMEMFHGLSDGTGGFAFLKAVLYRYLERRGEAIQNDGSIMTIDQEPSASESEDSYNTYFTEEPRIKSPFIPAYRISGKRFVSRSGVGIIAAKVATEELVNLAKAHGCTISEYLVTLMYYSIMKTGPKQLLAKRPVAMTVPINLRKFFPSQSIRNFSLYLSTSIQTPSYGAVFDELLQEVKRQFVRERTIPKLQNRLNLNVAFEKTLWIQLLPLFIKNIAFKIGYAVIGDLPYTTSLSNFGQVDLPDSMAKHVDSFEFNLASGKKKGLAVNSFRGKTSLVFNRCFQDTALEETFLAHLGHEGLHVTIQSNEWQ